MELGGELMLLGVGVMVGVIVGFLLAHLRTRGNDRDARLSALQQEYEDYRSSVRNHFIDTVAAINKIDEQQKELYRSVAAGVTELCQPNKNESDDYFIEQTMQTLGQIEPPEKDRKSAPELN